MGPDAAGQGGQQPSSPQERPRGAPRLRPQVRVRPWWFPVEDMSRPLGFYLEAWLADQIFGERPGRARPLGQAPHPPPPPQPPGRPGPGQPFPLTPGPTRPGPHQAVVSQLAWRSRALVHVSKVARGTVAEVSILGRPAGQNRVKSFLLSLAARGAELQDRPAEKMPQPEEFLKSPKSGADIPQHPA
ncbi:oocyte-expressed protein homolog [Perognathus longimembris pacificus]|uniref:oocyte-expressed protein homolog n=1 Tax=Perognathus longimembris pacificus TaxID=214514 RepID=UPI002019E02F|nr:oocyte-expressed protein homolog [Perognathus longimembris pacificus]